MSAIVSHNAAGPLEEPCTPASLRRIALWSGIVLGVLVAIEAAAQLAQGWRIRNEASFAWQQGFIEIVLGAYGFRAVLGIALVVTGLKALPPGHSVHSFTRTLLLLLAIILVLQILGWIAAAQVASTDSPYHLKRGAAEWIHLFTALPVECLPLIAILVGLGNGGPRVFRALFSIAKDRDEKLDSMPDMERLSSRVRLLVIIAIAYGALEVLTSAPMAMHWLSVPHNQWPQPSVALVLWRFAANIFVTAGGVLYYLRKSSGPTLLVAALLGQLLISMTKMIHLAHDLSTDGPTEITQIVMGVAVLFALLSAILPSMLFALFARSALRHVMASETVG